MSSGTSAQASVHQDLLETRLQALEDLNRQVLEENQDLRQRLDASQRHHSPGSADNPKEPKVSNPEPYDGRSKLKLGHFLLALSIVFRTQASRFPDDSTKISYAISYLRGDAMAWVEPFANKEPIDQPAFMRNYSIFVRELRTIFGDPDKVATAERSIRQLRQTTSASAYFAEFRRLSATLDWNDSALASQAYVGLKPVIKDELARVGRPTTLNELILTATRIDTRIQERDFERARERPSPSVVVNTSPSPNASVATSIKVKQERLDSNLDKTRRGPLSEQEKDRRRREGLCLYCAAKGHTLVDCPSKPKDNRHAKAHQTSVSSEN